LGGEEKCKMKNWGVRLGRWGEKKVKNYHEGLEGNEDKEIGGKA
jgi:hypothetical protein